MRTTVWINKHRLNNSLVVLIHGLFGDRFRTWQDLPTKLQEQLQSDPLIRSYDFYLFGYPSRFRQPPITPFIVGELDHFFQRIKRKCPDKYNNTTVIAHSQGGVLAKLYIIDKLLQRKGLELSIDSIITYGTPHKGVHLFSPICAVQKFPFVGSRIPLRQVGDLASISSNIRTLKKYWREPYIKRQRCEPTETSRYIHSVTLAGARDRYVSYKSAIGFPIDIIDTTMDGHTRMSGALDDVIEKLRYSNDPEKMRRQVEFIRSKVGKRNEYIKKNFALVARRVHQARPNWEDDLVELKTISILVDFLYDFDLRPLRMYDELSFALLAYAQREMEVKYE